jgi:WhiB family redox-sensing transcriptional regulator
LGVELNDWFSQGKCRDFDTDLFYPEPGEVYKSKKAISVCQGCPVRAECLTWAMTEHETFGVWGGLTYRSRTKLSRLIDGDFTISIARQVINDGLL